MMNNSEYVYYTKHKDKEHMLYAKEIAQLFEIYTRTNHYHSNFIKAYLKKWQEKYSLEQYYYPNKYGLSEVYNKDTYLKAMLSLFDELNISITDNIQKEFTIKVNDIKYTIFICRRMCDE